MNTLAKIVSIILQPILIPLYGVTMMAFTDPVMQKLSNSSVIAIIIVVFLTTAIIPATTVSLGLWLGMIGDTFISKRSERTIPYIISFVSYILGALWLSNIGLPIFYTGALYASSVSIASIAICNLKWKISAHLNGMGGLTGGLVAYSFLYAQPLLILISVSVLLGGIVGWSRMTLKAHTLAQVCCGWLTGFLIVTIGWILLAS